MNAFELDFSKSVGLIPAIIQEDSTESVLMLGYMNNVSLQKSIDTGYVYFYSRRRKSLWKKGESSGNTLRIRRISKDCDGDALLIRVSLCGNSVCHTGNRSCFFSEIRRGL